MFEDCNEEYVVPRISFSSFVITDFVIIFVGFENIRFDSKVRFQLESTPDSIRNSIRTQTADSQVPTLIGWLVEHLV